MITIFSCILDWILRISGTIALLWCLFSLFIKTNEFSTNIKITRFIDRNVLDKYSHYTEFSDPDLTGEYLVFEPQDTIIRKVRIYKIKWTVKKIIKVKKIAEFKNITPGNQLIYNSYFPEGAPSKRIEWIGEYGTKGIYTLAENGKTGNVDKINYIYQFGLIQNIRKRLELK